MTDDKIAEIRKRHAFADEHKSVIRPSGFSWTIPGWQAHNDRTFLLAEIERLTRQRDEARAALKPFAALFLWPDDVGDELTVNFIRSDEDWSDEQNDAQLDDKWVRRGDIRSARKALEAKP